MSILKIKDSQGNWVGVSTVKGDTGNGISSAVLNNDYTLTLTFTDGTTYTTPSIRGEKGERGEPATDMDIHICSASEYDSETRIPTITSPDDKTFYLVPTVDGTSPDLFTEWVYVNNAWEMFGSAKIDLSGYLTDVQIKGQSIVSDGVANVPIATMPTSGTDAGNLGLTCFKRGRGISINTTDNSIYIDYPSLAQVKAGNDTFKPVTTAHQHESTFYGLAKAASDTTQSASSNAVGMYTDEAKAKIQSMLGFGGFELIKTVELTEDSANIEIDTDEAGNAYRLTEMMILVTARPSASTTGNANVYVKNNSFSYIAMLSGVVRTTATTFSGFIKNLIVPNVSGESCVTEHGFTNATGNFYWNGKFPTGTEKDYSDYLSVYTIGTAKFGAGTVLMLYGRRK